MKKQKKKLKPVKEKLINIQKLERVINKLVHVVIIDEQLNEHEALYISDEFKKVIKTIVSDKNIRNEMARGNDITEKTMAMPRMVT